MSGHKAAVSKLSFEEALAALEAVVEKLEGGDTPLEESIDLYERGAALRRHCEAKLKDAELKVQRIVADGEEATGTVPMDPADPAAAPAAGEAAKGKASQASGSGDDIPF